ncbi:MAG: imidazolonepropionase [Betaproteobacteria bacterium]|nr:imidazolonepropionase [Betaproteobacteria bacterium]
MKAVLWRNARAITLASAAGWGVIERAAVLTEAETIRWIGPQSELPADLERQLGVGAVAEVDLGGALLTPGLIDCHTHLVYGGHRAAEFEMRLEGASYEAIARAGGGIRSTVAATRAASDERLFEQACARARVLMTQGVTTIEVKSGYGLDEHHEARSLRCARKLAQALGLTVRTTCLAAHAIPPEFDGRADAYIDAVCTWLPQWHAQGLVDAVDAFCEHIAFSPDQVRRVFECARALGLPVKLHAEQLSDQGGAALAAEFGALSCDHLEWVSDTGIAAMASAGSVAVLLPGAFYCLRETRLPPVQALRNAGVPIALATDHNPGSSPILSPTLVFNLACTLFRLTPEEALRGMTVHAARALGLHDRGLLAVGMRADFALWELEHPAELAYWVGQQACRSTVLGGTLV